MNGDHNSVQAPRARHLFESTARIVFKERGRVGSIGAILGALRDPRAAFVYCIDAGVPGAVLAAGRRALTSRAPFILELGDPAEPLLANQSRPAWQVRAAAAMDRYLPRSADALVFRGSYLSDYFARVIQPHPLPLHTWLPDGVDTSIFRPMRDDPRVARLRSLNGLDGKFVVGLVGNIHHNPTHNLFYGWELAGALAALRDEPRIAGVVVGNGPGTPVLQQARADHGLEGRLHLVGRVPHADVPLWMNVFDVALSTQTDDPVGWGRTTAKLPEYLACGTPVLCTDVGEAHRWLRDSGQTLPYHGMRDEAYPERLAARIRELATTDMSALHTVNRQLALRLFDYDKLRGDLAAFLRLVGAR